MRLTIIGSKMNLTGELYSSDDIRVDGNYSGSIITKGKLVVSKEGFISGNVHAKAITIQGKSEGEFESEDTFQIDPGGHFEGSVKTRLINITETAYFNGTCAIIPDGDFQISDKDAGIPKIETKQFSKELKEKVKEAETNWAKKEEEQVKEKEDKRSSENNERNDDELNNDEKQNSFVSNSLSHLQSL